MKADAKKIWKKPCSWSRVPVRLLPKHSWRALISRRTLRFHKRGGTKFSGVANRLIVAKWT